MCCSCKLLLHAGAGPPSWKLSWLTCSWGRRIELINKPAKWGLLCHSGLQVSVLLFCPLRKVNLGVSFFFLSFFSVAWSGKRSRGRKSCDSDCWDAQVPQWWGVKAWCNIRSKASGWCLVLHRNFWKALWFLLSLGSFDAAIFLSKGSSLPIKIAAILQHCNLKPGLGDGRQASVWPGSLWVLQELARSGRLWGDPFQEPERKRAGPSRLNIPGCASESCYLSLQWWPSLWARLVLCILKLAGKMMGWK